MKIESNLNDFLIEREKNIEFKLKNNYQDRFEQFNVENIEKNILDVIDKINNTQIKGENSIKNFLLGKENLHTVLFNLEKAKFTLNFSIKVRDKIIEAYQNIMRMQI